MQIKKEEVAGKLYLMSMYSAGVLRRHTPRERGERKKVTSEAKRKINAMRRKYGMMLLVGENFESGRDLFLYLGHERDVAEDEDKRCMRKFHREMGKLYRQLGIEYRYIDVRETHRRDGEPCRLHHHLIISGTGRLMLGRIAACWGCGGVDVRVLRELTDNFEDTCRYLLKERKEKGRRAYSCSLNLRRPPDPLRRRVPGENGGEVPPGVKVVNHELRDTEFGRYEIMVGKVVDQGAFDRYWRRVQADKQWLVERSFWRSQATRTKRRKREDRPPVLAGNGV